MRIGPRHPIAAQVMPHGGLGLGLPTTTTLPTRQWARPPLRVRQVVPIDWRPQGPQQTYGPGGGAAPDGGAGLGLPCDDCS